MSSGQTAQAGGPKGGKTGMEERTGGGKQWQGGQTTVNIEKYLHDADFPATRDDLVECARSNDAPQDVIQKLRDLPDEEFDDLDEVRNAY